MVLISALYIDCFLDSKKIQRGRIDLQNTWYRISKKSLFIFLAVALVLPMIQMLGLVQVVRQGGAVNTGLWDSPYTLWIGIDSFKFSSAAYYLILPIIAAMPVAGLLKADLRNGYFMQVKMRRSLRESTYGYYIWTFLLGGLIVTIPLVLNFTAYALTYPSVFPDNLLNQNLLVIHKNTLWVALYYHHPLLHTLLNIMITFVWSGLIALFATGVTMIVNNRFLAISAGFIVQLFLLLLQGLNVFEYSLAPADFLKQTGMHDVSVGAMTVTTVLVIIVTYVLLKKGVQRSFDL
ncbi:hypothetical protein N7X57_07130 [Lactiplantibacillus paraplantarum]|uniref:hypothetical protein n=1 Tax=Lactiplantibacillus paraplantarum TaxID=60520 RepID=UPI000B316021|nr:hypothetical protein [Lactiplantibacillus paraplantarum]MCW1910217.1 hypothetical protein [Lactiplantibacillus paraplantarum]